MSILVSSAWFASWLVARGARLTRAERDDRGYVFFRFEVDDQSGDLAERFHEDGVAQRLIRARRRVADIIRAAQLRGSGRVEADELDQIIGAYGGEAR